MEQKYIEREDFSLVNTKIKKTGTKSNKKSQCKAKKLGYNFFENYNKELLKFASNNKDYCYESIFEDLFDKNKVKNIFKFLGKDFNVKEYDKIINSY